MWLGRCGRDGEEGWRWVNEVGRDIGMMNGSAKVVPVFHEAVRWVTPVKRLMGDELEKIKLKSIWTAIY